MLLTVEVTKARLSVTPSNLMNERQKQTGVFVLR